LLLKFEIGIIFENCKNCNGNYEIRTEIIIFWIGIRNRNRLKVSELNKYWNRNYCQNWNNTVHNHDVCVTSSVTP